MTRPRAAHLPGDEILSEIADLLIEQNRVLGDIRDRLPSPAGGRPVRASREPVEVTEPAPKRAPQPSPPAEPESSPDEPVEVREPKPRTTVPAKKTQGRRTRG